MATKFITLDHLKIIEAKIKALLAKTVSKSGDTMTGNLQIGNSTIETNGYITGTWLRTTSISNKGSNTGKVAVIDNSGWIYYRTPKEIVAEAGEKTKTVAYTVLRSGWSSNTYSELESLYPSASYDIVIGVNSTATAAQIEAWNGANILGSANSNTLTAKGTVPTIDIPVIVKVTTKTEVVASTLLASGWSNGTYSALESLYPGETNDILVSLNSTATAAQIEAWNGANILGSATSNVLTAKGTVPTINIPVIVKVTTKN